jgi:hypothetical protein
VERACEREVVEEGRAFILRRRGGRRGLEVRILRRGIEVAAHPRPQEAKARRRKGREL